MSTAKAYSADELLTGFEIVKRPLLVVEDGRFVRVTTLEESESPAGTVYLAGITLAPGFLDVHVHGAGGHDVMEGTAAVARVGTMLARHGTTDWTRIK